MMNKLYCLISNTDEFNQLHHIANAGESHRFTKFSVKRQSEKLSHFEACMMNPRFSQFCEIPSN